MLELKLGFQIRKERRTRRLKLGASLSTNWVNFNLHLQVLKPFGFVPEFFNFFKSSHYLYQAILFKTHVLETLVDFSHNGSRC